MITLICTFLLWSAGPVVMPTAAMHDAGAVVTSSVRFTRTQEVPTGRDLDLAIVGPGFFQVRTAQGELCYTRHGSFRRDYRGTITTSRGYPLQPTLVIPADATMVVVSEDGHVSVMKGDTGVPTLIGAISLFRFADTAGLEARGRGLYSQTVRSGRAQQATPGVSGVEVLHQGALERQSLRVLDALVELTRASCSQATQGRAMCAGDHAIQQVNHMLRQ